MAPGSALVRDADARRPARGGAGLDAVVGERRAGGEPDGASEHGQEEHDPSHVDPLVSGRRRSHEVSRSGGRVVTPDFQATWREIEPVLRATIRRWGIDPHAAADLSQDVAERAWRRSIEFTDSGDLLRWCRVVARNLIVDRYRRSGREILSAADAVCTESAEDVVVSRLEVERLVAAFSRLPASEQQAIVGRTDLPATSAERVRRHRARERFARAIAAASAIAAWIAAAARRWRAPAAAAAVVPTLIVALALSGVLPFNHTTDDAPPPADGGVAAARLADAVADPSGGALGQVAPRGTSQQPAAALPLPARRVDVPLPNGGTETVRTYHVPVDEPTLCLFDQPLVGTICTPL